MAEEDPALTAARAQVWAMREGHGPPVELALALENQARLEQRFGRLKQARASAEQALRLYEQATGESVEVANCLHTLANIHIEAEDWNATHAVLDRALYLTSVHLHARRSWAGVRYTFARFLLLAKKPEYVLTVMEDLVTNVGNARASSAEEAMFFNSTTGKAYELGAYALIQMERGEDAVELLERAWPFFEAGYPPGHPEVVDFVADCVESCRSIGDTEATRRFQIRAMALRPS